MNRHTSICLLTTNCTLLLDIDFKLKVSIGNGIIVLVGFSFARAVGGRCKGLEVK